MGAAPLAKAAPRPEIFGVLFFMGEARGFHGTERSVWPVRYSVAVCP